MDFDPCPEQITKIILKAARLRRKDLGMPEEKNITVLYDEMAPLLGIAPTRKSSLITDHLPSPSEMKTEGGTYVIPRRDCPECGKKDSFRLDPLCLSCADSEGGRYKSMWFCGEMVRGTRSLIPGTGCGHKEQSEDPVTKYKVEHGMEVEIGFKKAMGMETRTDEGLK